MADRQDYNSILVETAGGITSVTLNGPDKRNAMSPALDEEMLDCMLVGIRNPTRINGVCGHIAAAPTLGEHDVPQSHPD